MSAQAFIAYLRCEANLADERARSLRATAAAIEAHALHEDAEHRKQKRKRDPNRPKRQHTAYTMFVQDNYELIKKNDPTMASKDIISIVAKQWASVSEEEKQVWKQRASATKDAQDALASESTTQERIEESEQKLDLVLHTDEKASLPKRKKMAKRPTKV